MKLYLTWIIAVAILLMVGSDTVRIAISMLLLVDDPTVHTIGVVILALGAWPLWRVIKLQAEQQAFSGAARFLDALQHDPEDTQPHDSDRQNSQ